MGDECGRVKFPMKAVDKGEDLLAPTRAFLVGLNLTEVEKDKPDGKGTDGFEERPFTGATKTPYSFQVIYAGTLQFSRSAAKIVAYFGGATVIVGALGAAWNSSDTPLQIAFVGGTALVIAALAIALAVIVRSDVQARATAQAAEYHARGDVAVAFLNTCRQDTDQHTPQHFLKIKGNSGWKLVDSFEKSNGAIRVRLHSGGSVDADEVAELDHT